MKATILAIATLFTTLVSTSLFAQAGDKINPGDQLPASTAKMKNATGNPIVLKDAMGANGLLVMFSCNTCPFVIKNQSITNRALKMAATYKVGVIIVNSNEAKRSGDDSYEAMQTYAKVQGYNVPYVIDENSALADMFGAGHTPEVFLFDAKGRLVYKGGMSDNASDPENFKKLYLEDAIKAVAGGMKVDPQVTKSVGCSIKRKA